LPVIATDVGSIREDVIEGRTGFICSPRDAADLAATIEKYFASDLFKSLDTCRRRIRDYANAKYSWQSVAHTTSRVYEALL
jgi:glycosyltransferase involved in cell wall biosynthesis